MMTDHFDKPFFRQLTPNDADSMANLERRCFGLPWSRGQCGAALRQKSFAAFGLWSGEWLIAYISCYHTDEELEILNLGVVPEERRKGHASRLLGLLLQAAAKMGMQKAVLEVRESNAAAMALYVKHGFRQCGIRPRYYPDTNEDALIHSRLLEY